MVTPERVYEEYLAIIGRTDAELISRTIVRDPHQLIYLTKWSNMETKKMRALVLGIDVYGYSNSPSPRLGRRESMMKWALTRGLEVDKLTLEDIRIFCFENCI